ncbi:peptide methionine sulfoxide reductase MsrA-like isoform X2 [Ranitomeya variabilis]|uniref:peptide methionine sulfoxide reductase MsrA-like isoform X2 n=1 Tax=Ranitomeya variabilis TaxID=490064 RepID=UPI004055E806
MPSKTVLPTAEEALPGRAEALKVAAKHAVNGNSMLEPYPAGFELAMFGLTAHIEVVRVVYDPKVISYKSLLKLFWENHNPTDGMKQEKDIGTQYRSVIFTYSDQQREAALQSIDSYQKELKHCNLGAITTEILPVPEFYYAEDYHQQYLQKIPDGYCGLKGTGVSCVL